MCYDLYCSFSIIVSVKGSSYVHDMNSGPVYKLHRTLDDETMYNLLFGVSKIPSDVTSCTELFVQ